MKILLAISLLLNVILGVLYYQESHEPPLERIVIEHIPEVIEKEVIVKVEPKTKTKKTKAQSASSDHNHEMIDQDYMDQIEQIETSKKDFLIGQLGLSEETLREEVKLRREFIRASNKIYENSPMGQPSIDERRKLLDLEEETQEKVIKLYGKSKWERYLKFQQKYNQESTRRMEEELGGPTLLMSP